MAYIQAAVRFFGQAIPAVPAVRCSLNGGSQTYQAQALISNVQTRVDGRGHDERRSWCSLTLGYVVLSFQPDVRKRSRSGWEGDHRPTELSLFV
ncbi:hypothetical protein [Paenibacillus amylolyticus]